MLVSLWHSDFDAVQTIVTQFYHHNRRYAILLETTEEIMIHQQDLASRDISELPQYCD